MKLESQSVVDGKHVILELLEDDAHEVAVVYRDDIALLFTNAPRLLELCKSVLLEQRYGIPGDIISDELELDLRKTIDEIEPFWDYEISD